MNNSNTSPNNTISKNLGETKPGISERKHLVNSDEYINARCEELRNEHRINACIHTIILDLPLFTPGTDSRIWNALIALCKTVTCFYLGIRYLDAAYLRLFHGMELIQRYVSLATATERCAFTNTQYRSLHAMLQHSTLRAADDSLLVHLRDTLRVPPQPDNRRTNHHRTVTALVLVLLSALETHLPDDPLLWTYACKLIRADGIPPRLHGLSSFLDTAIQSCKEESRLLKESERILDALKRSRGFIKKVRQAALTLAAASTCGSRNSNAYNSILYSQCEEQNEQFGRIEYCVISDTSDELTLNITVSKQPTVSSMEFVLLPHPTGRKDFGCPLLFAPSDMDGIPMCELSLKALAIQEVDVEKWGSGTPLKLSSLQRYSGSPLDEVPTNAHDSLREAREWLQDHRDAIRFPPAEAWIAHFSEPSSTEDFPALQENTPPDVRDGEASHLDATETDCSAT